jgi:WD40 repeat protein/tRNA A-37 threonylcarbamoyl transferase component Bud32
VPPAAQPDLLRELLLLELEYRPERGENPQREEYYRRFPQQAELIDTVFDEYPVSLLERPTRLLPPAKGDHANSPEADTELDNARPAVRILGDYELLSQLGKGGMGVVYRARQRSVNRIVALKVIRSDQLEQLTPEERQEWSERFRREAEMAACLHHDNLVAIYDVDQIAGVHFYSMRFVEGQSLAELLREGPVANRRAALHLEQVARALHALHIHGIVHRDLKPRNILLDAANDRPFLTDFGLAKWSEYGHRLTQTGACVGTPEYMAPEQTRNAAGVNAASDIYSLGATLYDMLTARPPFRAADAVETLRQVREEEALSPRRLNPAVDRDLELICLKCLEKEPHKRYKSALEVAEELRRYCTGEPLRLTRPIGKAERVWRWCRRKPLQAAFTGLAGFVLLAVTALSISLAVILQLSEEKKQTQAAHREATYAAQMKLAHQFWQSGDLRSMVELLSPYARQPDRRDLRDFVWYYLWSLCHSERLSLRVDAQDVYCVAFSPDGKFLATADHDGTVKLWEASTGQRRTILLGHTDEVNCVAFSPDGKTLASASDDQTVRLWDTRSGQQQKCLPGHRGNVLCVAFSPDGKLLVSAGDDMLVKLWDPVTAEHLADLRGHTGVIESLALTGDGQLLASAGRDGSVRLWDVMRRLPRGVLCERLGRVETVAFSGNSGVLATGADDGRVRLWEVATGQEKVALLGHTDRVESVTFSPDGKTLISAGNDGTVRVWDVETAKQRNILKGHTDRVWCVEFSPDGRTLATASRDGTVKLWDPEVRQERESLPEDTSRISSVAFTPHSHLAVGRKDGTAHFWDPARRQILWSTSILGEGGSITSLDVSSDGQTLAAGSSDGSVTLLDLTARQTPRLLKANQRGAIDLVLFTADRTLLTQTRAEAVQLWDLPAGRLRGQLPAADGNMLRLDVSSAGRMLAAWNREDSFSIWDLTTLKLRCGPCRHKGLHSIAFSPDARNVATGGSDGTVKLWNTHSGQEEASLLGHAGLIVSLAFSPDGRILATSSQERKVKLLHLATRQELVTLEGHGGLTQTMAFAPDGQTLVSTAANQGRREIYLWPGPKDQP